MRGAADVTVGEGTHFRFLGYPHETVALRGVQCHGGRALTAESRAVDARGLESEAVAEPGLRSYPCGTIPVLSGTHAAARASFNSSLRSLRVHPLSERAINLRDTTLVWLPRLFSHVPSCS